MHIFYFEFLMIKFSRLFLYHIIDAIHFKVENKGQ